MKTWKTSNIHQQRKFKQIILQTNNGILDCFLKELGKSELIKNDNQDSELNEKSKSQNNYVKYNSTFILKRTNLYTSKMSRNVYTRKMFTVSPLGVEWRMKRETDFLQSTVLFDFFSLPIKHV